MIKYEGQADRCCRGRRDGISINGTLGQNTQSGDTGAEHPILGQDTGTEHQIPGHAATLELVQVEDGSYMWGAQSLPQDRI